MRRIKTVADPVITALLSDARWVTFSVTGDDFDRDDNWGPGDYSWAEVTDDVATRWDAGLIECERADLDPRSREGLSIRWRAMRGDVPMAQGLIAWLAERERREAGPLANIGPPPPPGDPADAERWSRITGHRYAPELLAALAALERDRVTAGCYSWLGGTHGLNQIEARGVVPAYAGRNSTGMEKEARLRDYLRVVAERHPAQGDRLQRVAALVRPGSILEECAVGRENEKE